MGSTVRKGSTTGGVGQTDLKNTKSMPLRQSARSEKMGWASAKKVAA